MQEAEIEDQQIGNRSDPRTSMFVMASMSASSVSGPVRIRNLSGQGGLIEGPQLPSVGETLQLRKARLSASGRVVWKAGNRVGIRLDHSIVPAEWLPSGHPNLNEIDDTFQRLKAGVGTLEAPRAEDSPAHSLDPGQLRKAARALDALADDLSEDTELIVRHAGKLQSLDIASHLLRKMADELPLID